MMYWTPEEDALMEKFFKTSITEMTLYKNIHQLNPKRTYEAMMRRLRTMRSKRYKKNKEECLKKLKIGYLDIEASNLNADYGFMLSWVIKEKGKAKIYGDVIQKKDIMSFKFDENVIKSLLETMKEFDVLYAHYGSDRRFDIPFIRTRALKHHLEHLLPHKMECFIMDTWMISRNKLKLHNNRLDSIARHLDIKIQKTHLDSKQWMRASIGDTDSLEYVYDHNVKDVKILEKVHKRLEGIERASYKSI